MLIEFENNVTTVKLTNSKTDMTLPVKVALNPNRTNQFIISGSCVHFDLKSSLFQSSVEKFAHTPFLAFNNFKIVNFKEIDNTFC